MIKTGRLRRHAAVAMSSLVLGGLLISTSACSRIDERSKAGAARATAPEFDYSIGAVETIGVHPETLKVHFHPPVLSPHDGPLSFVRHLGWAYPVSYLGFSRTGRFLAIEYENGPMIIWDVKSRRESARFSASGGISTQKVLWGPDDRFVTIGQSIGHDTFNVWDPLSGKVIATPQGIASVSALSPDGQNLITYARENSGAQPILRRFETKTWTFKDIPFSENKSPSTPCYGVNDIEWSGNGKIYIVGVSVGGVKSADCTLDGVASPAQPGLFILEMNSGGLLSPEVRYLDYTAERVPGDQVYLGASRRFSFSSNAQMIAFSSGFTIDLRTLQLRRVNFDYDYIDSGQSTFSADGRLLYLLRTKLRRHGSPGSWGTGDRAGGILDVATGQIVGSFPAGANFASDGGVATSHDGDLLAASDGYYVNIYRLK